MSDELHPSNHVELSQADAQALDALIDAGLVPSRTPKGVQDRASHVAHLLSLLDTSVRTDATLVDVTLARVNRAGSPGHVESADTVLSQEDAEALDAYVAAEFRAGKVASSLRPRAERLEAMVQLVSQTRTIGKPSASLVDRTMRRVATSTGEGAEPIPMRGAGGFRFADLISVAAVLIMGTAVLWPILSTVKTYQQKGSCLGNLGTIASALGSYTGDSQDMLPMATASYGGSWLNVGTTPDRSNSSNLFTLARTGYTKIHDLACAGNRFAAKEASPQAQDWRSLPEVSYSYYIMFGKQRPSPQANPKTIILADKSPVALLVAKGQPASTGQPVTLPDWNSPNHQGRGQWALRADGTSVWLNSSKDNGDNIWLSDQMQAAWDTAPKPKGQNVLIQFFGTELPLSPNDSFLGP